MNTPKFTNPHTSFYPELRKRIQAYFKEQHIETTGNTRLHLKALFLVSCLVVTYVHLVFFTPPVVFALIECILLGTIVSAIGFNVMHDGAHGSFSKYKWLNDLAAFSLNVLGGSDFMWKVKHNVVHHTYTNIDGFDDDIDAGFWLRLSETQKKYKLHRFQHIYFWGLYSMLYIFWIFYTDFKKIFTKKVGNIPLKKMSTAETIIFWGMKLFFVAIFMIIPIIKVGFVSWLVGFLCFAGFSGLVLSIVFQLAHTVEHTSFPVPEETTGNIDDDWAIHQLKTTANFATKNKLVTWFVGGLNFQVEHHLFPKISHVHYPHLNKILKETCNEYQVSYIEYPRMTQALASHISFLKKMGTV